VGDAPAEARMNETLLDIVEELEQFDGMPEDKPDPNAPDALPALRPEDAAQLRVVCVAGRGAFDDVTTAIAVQLLTRRGFAPVTANYAQFRRGHMETLGIDGAAIVCVVTLDAPEAPPYLRNLLRRIRERAPRAQLIVGIGGQSERVDEVGALSDTQNANAFSDLVNQCVQAAAAASAPPLVEKAPRSVDA